MYALKVIQSATGLPVSLDDFKLHLGIYHDEKDDNLEILLNAAVAQAESFTGRVFRTGGQVMEQYIDSFTDTTIGTAPVTGIESVKYFDAANDEQTLGAAYYDANIYSTPPTVEFISAPVPYDRHDAVTIRFTAGYATAEAVPYNVKAAILLFAQYLYDNPGDAVKQLPSTTEYLLRDFKIH